MNDDRMRFSSMFSGIVETQVPVVQFSRREGVGELILARPETFLDLAVGDSVAVNGVCLTVENLESHSMTFALGLETLKITSWDQWPNLESQFFNVERSLKLGDRLHGHFVLGHVDTMSEVLRVEFIGEGCHLQIGLPPAFKLFLWKKGSVTVNGVSLTIHHLDVEGQRFSVGLIPETLKRTNLGSLKVGHFVTLEFDQWARGFVRWMEEKGTLQMTDLKMAT